MKQRPLSITLFCLFMIGVCISLPLQAIYQQDFESLFRSLTSLNIAVAILCFLNALAAYNVHISFRYLLPLTFVTVIFNNWWVGNVGLNYDASQTTAASFGFMLF